MAVPKIEDDGDSNDSLMSDDDMPVNTSGMLTHATAGGGMQTLTMTNAASTAAQVANNSTGATIVQYAQGADGQFFIPGRFSYNPPKQVYLRVTYVLQSLEKCLKKYQLLYLVCECTLSLTFVMAQVISAISSPPVIRSVRASSWQPVAAAKRRRGSESCAFLKIGALHSVA